MNEHQIRDYIHKLRRFYTDALIYGIVNLGLILIWALSGGGYFWPVWVIIGWGIGLGVHAFSLGLIPQMNAWVPFMTAEWEDQEVRRLMEAGHKAPTKVAVKKEVTKELRFTSPAKKTSSVKKRPKKKAVPKKAVQPKS